MDDGVDETGDGNGDGCFDTPAKGRESSKCRGRGGGGTGSLEPHNTPSSGLRPHFIACSLPHTLCSTLFQTMVQ